MEFSKNQRRKMRRRGSLAGYYEFFISVFLYGDEKNFIYEVDYIMGPNIRFSLTEDLIPHARAKDPELAASLEAGLTSAIERISQSKSRYRKPKSNPEIEPTTLHKIHADLAL